MERLEMKIIIARPPNFEDIVRVFPTADNPNIIFAYNNAIYSPSGFDISEHLIAHEQVHCKRQGNLTGTEIWWNEYLSNPEFRYNEELLAHRAEYRSMIRNAINRNQRRNSLKIVSKKLALPLYENMVSKKQAGKDILNEMD